MAAVIRDRLVHGYRPGIAAPGEVLFQPLTTACVGIEFVNPPPEFSNRFKPELHIRKYSECNCNTAPRSRSCLSIGPVRRVGIHEAHVDWVGLGDSGAYEVRRVGKTWKAVGPVGGGSWII